MGVAQKNIHSGNKKVILNDWLVPKNVSLSCEMVVMFSLTLLLTGADPHPWRPRGG